MQELTHPSKVTGKVYGVIAETLGLEEETLEGEGSLIDNYGAESLDFLDLSFRLNKEFSIKLFRGDFLDKATTLLGADGIEIMHDAHMTQAGVDLLKARMPESADNPLLVEGMPKSTLQRLYNGTTWVRLVNELLENPHVNGEEYCIQWLESYQRSLQS